MKTRDEDFADFASARWMPLVRAAMATGCSLPEAEDATQNTLLRAYVSWPKVVRADDQDAYVARMLFNACSDLRRGRSRRETPIGEVPDGQRSHTDPDVETADALRRAVSALNQGQREVIALRFYIRLTEAEIAKALNISPGTVKSRLSRALQALSKDPGLLQNGKSNE